MAQLERLWIVRHGESTGNVAAARAEAAGADLIDLSERDADVPLSATGREQAAATGRWLAELPDGERPEVAVMSPYLRAAQTAELALAGWEIPVHRDERLRDRELGILDLLTSGGVTRRHPEEAERRARLGKFYYRPPGGESWADVALRLRSLLGDLRREYADRRVILFGHEALVFLLRYLVEPMTEPDLIDLARRESLGNCSVTGWRCHPGGNLELTLFNHVTHLREQGAEPTREEGVDAEPV